MGKEEVLSIVNTYYSYHRSNNGDIKRFAVFSNVETLSCKYVKAYGAYFNFDKNLYDFKGTYLYFVSLSIKNPFITHDQIYSCLITKEKKDELDRLGYDSVVLVRRKEIVEVIIFSHKQAIISEIINTELT